jgi:Protein-tyrosine phosphatase
MEIRVVVVCAECKVHWYEDSETATCTRSGHIHRRVELHRHRSVVVLPDGTSVMAASFDADDPYTRERSPDYGLYLDRQWQPPWPHDHLDWPDFGVPESTAPVVAALRSVLERARAGQRVEVGCLGGHGRTGAALACLAILSGPPGQEPVEWVRTAYCAEAIETPGQEMFVAKFQE